MWYKYLDANLMEVWLGTSDRFPSGDKDPFSSSLRTTSRFLEALMGAAQSRDEQQKTDLKKARLWDKERVCETNLGSVFVTKAKHNVQNNSLGEDKALYLNLLLLSEALHTKVELYMKMCNFWCNICKYISFEELKKNQYASYLISYLSVPCATNNYCPLNDLFQNGVISELLDFKIQDLEEIPGSDIAKEQWKKLGRRITDSASRTGRNEFFTAMEVLFSIRQKDKLKKYCKENHNFAALSSLLHDYASDASYVSNHLPSNNDMTMHSIPHQLIYFGAPGTGKSHAIKQLTKGHTVIRTTFHPESDYASFVGAYKPVSNAKEQYGLTATGETVKLVFPGNTNNPIKSPHIEYKFVKQAFLFAYVEAWKEFAKAGVLAKPVFLVIEELNRGNCSQIFGDLFQLLDRHEGFSEYPITSDEDLAQALCEPCDTANTSFGENGLELTEIQKRQINSLYSTMTNNEDIAEKLSKGRLLILPSNLYILATMNTSDQSLFPMDSAFKRRWEWKYIPICNVPKLEREIYIGYTDSNGEHKEKRYRWWDFLQAINKQIEETTHSEDKQLGYFFCKPLPDSNVISLETFVGKIVFYLWNDVFNTPTQRESVFSLHGKPIAYKDFYTSTDTDISLNHKTILDFIENIMFS